MSSKFFAMTLAFAALYPVAAAAQVGPPIAYAKGGSRPEIYLVNPDGSGLRLVYRGASRTKIFALDVKPGGGELSFEEVACCSSGPSYLKTVTYAATGTLGTVSRSLSTCRISGIDYHPSDGSVLMVDNCARKVMRLDAGSTTPVDIGVPGSVFTARWLSDGAGFVYGAQGWLNRSTISNPTQSTRLLAMEIMGDFDAGKQSQQLLHSVDDWIDHILLPAQFNKGVGQGSGASFAPGDQRFIYMTAPRRGLSYLKIRRVDGTGGEERIGAEAAYTSVDWRN